MPQPPSPSEDSYLGYLQNLVEMFSTIILPDTSGQPSCLTSTSPSFLCHFVIKITLCWDILFTVGSSISVEWVYIHFSLLSDVEKHRGKDTFPGGVRALCAMLTDVPVGDEFFIAPEQNPMIGSAKIALILIKTQPIHCIVWKRASNVHSQFHCPAQCPRKVGTSEGTIDRPLALAHHTTRVHGLCSQLSHPPRSSVPLLYPWVYTPRVSLKV